MKLRAGHLTTLNNDPYFDQVEGDVWFVQLWDGEHEQGASNIVARVYGPTIEEARKRADAIVKGLAQAELDQERIGQVYLAGIDTGAVIGRINAREEDEN